MDSPGQPGPAPAQAKGPTPQTPATPIPPDLRRAAVARLLGARGPSSGATVETFLAQAPNLGIDLTLMAGVITGDGPRAAVREVCLPVLGAGRTVMLFVSSAGSAPRGSIAERTSAVRAAVRLARRRHPSRVHLLQSLAHPGESWAPEVFGGAGLRALAELRYLSCALRAPVPDASPARAGRPVGPPAGRAWPEGVTVLAQSPGREGETRLREALEASYVETLDCPELAGLRTMDDILDAHRSIGEFDPALWWRVERRGRPLGAVLLNRCPQLACVELVYIGIAPELRGSGLGGLLLRRASEESSAHACDLRCAVDTRNAPAREMYRRAGFRETDRRIAFVGLARDVPES